MPLSHCYTKSQSRQGELGAAAALIWQWEHPWVQMPIATCTNPQHCLHCEIPLTAAVPASALLLLGIKVVSYWESKRSVCHCCRKAQRCYAAGTAGLLMGNSGRKHLRCLHNNYNHYVHSGTMSPWCLFAPLILFESLPSTT